MKAPNIKIVGTWNAKVVKTVGQEIMDAIREMQARMTGSMIHMSSGIPKEPVIQRTHSVITL